jgi:N utilization substance protein A
MDTESRQTHVLVAEDQLSLAIGKEGQNVRLAARLTGWKIDIKDKAKYDHAGEDAKFAAVRAQYTPEEDDTEFEELEYEENQLDEMEDLEDEPFDTNDEE